MRKLRIKLRNLIFRVKGLLYKLYLLSCGCKVGKGLKCKKIPIIRSVPYKNITIGDNVNIGYRITLDINKNGKLIIGNNVNLTQDIVISALTKVEIGNDVLIAEYVSIRDGDHKFDKEEKINRQQLSSKPIKIGADVWIGAGSRILKGAVLEKGSIIGSNSVVLEKTKTIEYGIYVGSPIKLKGERS